MASDTTGLPDTMATDTTSTDRPPRDTGATAGTYGHVGHDGHDDDRHDDPHLVLRHFPFHRNAPPQGGAFLFVTLLALAVALP